VEVYLTKDYWLDVGSIETYEKLDHAKLDENFRDLFAYEMKQRKRTK
jgi:NDP-sugar pyrophosphorylase family protein